MGFKVAEDLHDFWPGRLLPLSTLAPIELTSFKFSFTNPGRICKNAKIALPPLSATPKRRWQ